MDRRVTERDLRMPEYREGTPDDYEFDGRGKPVRKDRWERAVRKIACHTEVDRVEGWTPVDVVDAVLAAVAARHEWQDIAVSDSDTWPAPGVAYEVLLGDGSVLRGALFDTAERKWAWRGGDLTFDVVSYRDIAGPEAS